jgi:multicomponent Na+:H+ antiporter subunit F
MRTRNWLLGLVIIAIFLVINFMFVSIPLLFKFINVMLFCLMFLVVRVIAGPTIADHVVAVDILGIIIIGFCGLISIFTDSSHYLDIAMAWALQSFIGTTALAKLLEGRHLDD